VVTTTPQLREAFREQGFVVVPGVLDADQIDRLFLPFTRLDDRTRHDGFGLGLALVASIATVHNGTVHAIAVTTGGLDITVRLPRRNLAVTPTPSAT
jgi:K+-sensing histidine kinase KdpD